MPFKKFGGVFPHFLFSQFLLSFEFFVLSSNLFFFSLSLIISTWRFNSSSSLIRFSSSSKRMQSFICRSFYSLVRWMRSSSSPRRRRSSSFSRRWRYSSSNRCCCSKRKIFFLFSLQRSSSSFWRYSSSFPMCSSSPFCVGDHIESLWFPTPRPILVVVLPTSLPFQRRNPSFDERSYDKRECFLLEYWRIIIIISVIIVMESGRIQRGMIGRLFFNHFVE